MDDCSIKHEALNVRINHIEEVIRLRAVEMDRRMEGMNHLRQEVMTDRGIFLKKEVQDARNLMVDTRFQTIERLVYIGVGIVVALQFILRYVGVKP